MRKTNTFKFIKFFISLKVLILELVVVFICIVKKGSSERESLFLIDNKIDNYSLFTINLTVSILVWEQASITKVNGEISIFSPWVGIPSL